MCVQVWSTFPSSDYYGFIQTTNAHATIGALCAMVLIFVFISIKTFNADDRTQGGDMRADMWIMRGSVAIIAINVILYILWISTTQTGVDDVVIDAMTDVGRQFQDGTAVQTMTLAYFANLTNTLQWIQNLNINSGDPAADTSLDSHFCMQLRFAVKALNTDFMDAIKVGFDSGDVIGAVYYNSQVAVMVRSATTTGGDLVYYGTQGSGSSEMRNTSNELVRFRGYSCLEQEWYTTGNAQVRKSGSNFAFEGVTGTYFAPDGKLKLSVVIPYFLSSAETTPYGVIACDANTDWMSTMLKRLQVTDDASMMVAESLAEVVARDNNDNSMQVSSGTLRKINSTNCADDMAANVLRLMEENGDLKLSQDKREVRGAQLVATSMVGNTEWMAGNFDGFPSLYAVLANFTFVQVSPHCQSSH